MKYHLSKSKTSIKDVKMSKPRLALFIEGMYQSMETGMIRNFCKDFKEKKCSRADICDLIDRCVLNDNTRLYMHQNNNGTMELKQITYKTKL